MAGLVAGCLLAERLASASPISNPSPLTRGGSHGHLWRCLILVDVLLALLAVAIPFLLPALGALQSGPGTFVLVEWCVSIMVVLTGLLGGAAFPLAGRLQLGAGGRAGAAAGSVVGADHAGACLGALLCGILLVPVLGTTVAAFLLAGMKLSSAALLALGERLARAS
jgi:spermidine synthase